MGILKWIGLDKFISSKNSFDKTMGLVIMEMDEELEEYQKELEDEENDEDLDFDEENDEYEDNE